MENIGAILFSAGLGVLAAFIVVYGGGFLLMYLVVKIVEFISKLTTK